MRARADRRSFAGFFGRSTAAVAAVIFLSIVARAQSVCGEWTPHLFQVEGVESTPGTGGHVTAFATSNGPSGPILYVAGAILSAGTTAADNVAAWNGSSWSPLGGGLRSGAVNPGCICVSALAVFDDGSGPELYAGGDFFFAGSVSAIHIAKWNGHEWSAVGPGLTSHDGLSAISSVRSLAVFDDGSGPALYAGGEFDRAGTLAVNHIARWNGTSWSALGAGMGDALGSSFPSVNALAVFDDGSGPGLYAAGEFASAGGQPANRIARWNGSAWSPLGSGIGVLGYGVYALASYDDGTGPGLFAAGSFTTAGGLPAIRIAKWNGSAWSSLGAGLSPESAKSLAVWNDGSGPALYVAGPFDGPVGSTTHGIAKWNGISWSGLGIGLLGESLDSFALSVFDDGRGSALYVGGNFLSAGDALARGVARWNGSVWSPLVELTTAGRSFGNFCECLEVFDDGSKSTLIIGGTLERHLATARNHPLVQWDGRTWSIPPGDLDGDVHAVRSFDDGSGPGLFVGGGFTHAGSVSLSRVARWNGTSWAPLGEGFDADVRSFGVFDDGTGEALYVGGDFTHAGTLTVNRIAKWNGSAWTALGNGIPGVTPPNTVEAIVSFDDGTGAALYVGGYFFPQAGAPGYSIAKWNGSSWSSVGGSGVGGRIHAMEVLDDGSGPALYVGGSLGGAGSVATLGVVRWNGSAWSALDSGLDEFSPIVSALASFDDGSGAALYVGGFFDGAGHVASATDIARWNGSRWSSVGGGIDDWVTALKSFDDGTGPALYAAGWFRKAGGVVSNVVARWKPSPMAARRGSVNANSGDVADVLFVNGSSGDLNRVVDVVAGAPLDLRLDASPRGPLVSDYVLWAWAGTSSHPIDFDRGEGRIGCFSNPTPLQHLAFPQPVVCLRSPSVPSVACRGTSERPGPAIAPWTMHLPSGLRAPRGISIQGVIRDYGAANPSGFSATNAAVIQVQ
jgi:hypothetical protein